MNNDKANDEVIKMEETKQEIKTKEREWKQRYTSDSERQQKKKKQTKSLIKNYLLVPLN
jgi:hypothetical protein